VTIGKSALVQTFLDRVMQREDVVVLRGRCYEYESVPFKALAGVIDSLSQLLSVLQRSQVDRLLPPDLTALSRLFPVSEGIRVEHDRVRVEKRDRGREMVETGIRQLDLGNHIDEGREFAK
jgi:hypothetical protein